MSLNYGSRVADPNTVTFEEIQDTDNALTAVVLTCKLLKNAKFGYGFDLRRLHEIAQRSGDERSSTYLWHIWGLLNASADLQHYLSGLEIMFSKTIAHPYVMSQVSLLSPKKRSVESHKNNVISPTSMVAKMDSLESSDVAMANAAETGLGAKKNDGNNGGLPNTVESTHQITITATDEMDTLLQSPNTAEMERFQERSNQPFTSNGDDGDIHLVAENIYHSPSNKIRFGSPTHRTRLKVDNNIANNNLECSSPFSRRLRRLKRERQKVRRNSMGNIMEITDDTPADSSLLPTMPHTNHIQEQDDDESSTRYCAKPFNVEEFERLTCTTNDV